MAALGAGGGGGFANISISFDCFSGTVEPEADPEEEAAAPFGSDGFDSESAIEGLLLNLDKPAIACIKSACMLELVGVFESAPS